MSILFQSPKSVGKRSRLPPTPLLRVRRSQLYQYIAPLPFGTTETSTLEGCSLVQHLPSPSDNPIPCVENIWHKLLWVAVIQREPRALHLHHDPVTLPKYVVCGV
jgi:hypothetical protein